MPPRSVGVHDAAFAGPAEGRLVDALRDSGLFSPDLSLVAVTAGGDVVGHVLFSRLDLEVDGRDVPAVALAPLAVLPCHQRIGIGTRLVREGLRRLEALRLEAVIVLGDPAYYARFGFSQALAAPLASPYAGPHLQALALSRGVLSGARRGRIIYPAFRRFVTSPGPPTLLVGGRWPLLVGRRRAQAPRFRVQLVEPQRRDVDALVEAGGGETSTVGAERRLHHFVAMRGDRPGGSHGRHVVKPDAPVAARHRELRTVGTGRHRVAVALQSEGTRTRGGAPGRSKAADGLDHQLAAVRARSRFRPGRMRRRGRAPHPDGRSRRAMHRPATTASARRPTRS